MSSLVDRLRGVIGGRDSGRRCVVPDDGPGDGGHDERPDDTAADAGHDDIAEVLGGSWCESGGRRFLAVERTYTPGHRHGNVAVTDALPPTGGLWPRLSLLAGAGHVENTGPAAPERRWREGGPVLFIDLETTGLAGGAGTYAFLVGCGFFDGGRFRIRQFFLSDFGSERALLGGLADAAGEAGAIVTYNGTTFDLPLIETRFLLHRLATPFAGVPHVDMLHPARRLWRGEDEEAGSCRLSALEQSICGHAREGDVPGFEIPSRYFHFVRTGDARPLVGVLEHNRLDILSLALLTAHAAQLLEDGACAARTAREAYGLGRLYERAGLNGEAKDCFARAIELRGDGPTHAEALRAYAILSRRERRYEEAAGAWQRILCLRGCPPHIVREATDALAVHHEHRLRDPRTARTFALQALEFHGSPTRRQAIHHRLARLDRKMSRPQPAIAPLF